MIRLRSTGVSPTKGYPGDQINMIDETQKFLGPKIVSRDRVEPARTEGPTTDQSFKRQPRTSENSVNQHCLPRILGTGGIEAAS